MEDIKEIVKAMEGYNAALRELVEKIYETNHNLRMALDKMHRAKDAVQYVGDLQKIVELTR